MVIVAAFRRETEPMRAGCVPFLCATKEITQF
jgi:hypothetical protein